MTDNEIYLVGAFVVGPIVVVIAEYFGITLYGED